MAFMYKMHPSVSKPKRLTMSDIAQWIDNDESLYNWRRSSKMPMRKFIQEHRAELERAIRAVLDRKPLG